LAASNLSKKSVHGEPEDQAHDPASGLEKTRLLSQDEFAGPLAGLSQPGSERTSIPMSGLPFDLPTRGCAPNELHAFSNPPGEYIDAGSPRAVVTSG
jgi:hypothetical protein